MPSHPKTPLLRATSNADAPSAQRSSGRKNRRRHATAAVSRKRNTKLPLEWSEEEHDALLTTPQYKSSNGHNVTKTSNALATTANTLHVRALQEIFPSLERAVLQEVLMAARFQVDVAAAMLGELVRESPSGPAEVGMPETAPEELLAATQEGEQATLHAAQADHPLVDFEDAILDDDEDWSEVVAVTQSQETVMLHDGWEVVESEKTGVWP